MKPSYGNALIFLGLQAGITTAWPVIRSPIDLVKRIPQSYSVVPVDGGSATTTTASAVLATKTITDAITQTQTQTSIVISTIVASQSNSLPGTSIVLSTVTFETTIVQTQSPSETTVTVEPSSTPYDNGMWHTTYYFTATPTATVNGNNAVVTLSSSTSSAPTTTITDPGSWAPWSGENNGLWHGQ